MKYTTLKKEWSISCRDYITMGLTPEGKYILLCGDQPLTHPIDSVDVANTSFTYWVNKI